MYFREQANAMYSPASFFLAKIIIEIPITILMTLATTTTTYFIFGMSIEEPWQFWSY
jgi:ABC-type multidrug transport system permease subunit